MNEIKMFYLLEDAGDGSSDLRTFSSREAAEEYYEDAKDDCGIPDGVEVETFLLEGGKLHPKFGFDDLVDGERP